MDEINEIKKIVGHDDTPEVLEKDVSIIDNVKQYTIRIPKLFAEQCKISSKDKFRFRLISMRDHLKLEGELIGEKG